MNKLTFVTGWFRRHGIAYLDMVLQALDERQDVLLSGKQPTEPGCVLVNRKDQYELADTLGYSRKHQGGILKTFDKVVMLVPKSRKGLSDARMQDLISKQKWSLVRKSVER